MAGERSTVDGRGFGKGMCVRTAVLNDLKVSGRRLVLGGALALGVLAAPAMVGAQTAPFSGELPSNGGVALLMATQDVAPAALGDALGTAGCSATSISVTEGGSWLVYVPGAPTFVNAAFPAEVSANTGFAVLCAVAAPDDSEETAEDAVAVVESYFALLNDGDYEEAYALWRDGANDQTLEDFIAGYADTASVSVEVGTPGEIDPGAGQRYIPIPVVVTSTLDDGTEQEFEGTIVLHRTGNIDGSTAEQRTWRIYSSDLVQTN